MKRFTGYLILLLGAMTLVALGVDWLNVGLIRSSSGISAAKMERLYRNPEPDEIAVVGSSRALCAFVPSQISSQCFNYGEDGMTMGEVMSILEVLQKRKTTVPVVLNLDPWGNFHHSVVGDYRLAPESGRLSICERIPGVRFFGALRKNISGTCDVRFSATRVVDRGAKLIRTSRSAEEWNILKGKAKRQDFVVSADDRRRLLAILRSFAPRKVLVVVCPCSSSWDAHFVGQEKLSEFLRELKGLPNVSLFDYYGSKEFSDSDFVDLDHLNIGGAKKLTAILVKDMAKE